MLGYSFELEKDPSRFPGQPHTVYFARLRDKDGRIVAYARLMRGAFGVPDGVAVCDVETHPDHRRQGFATYLLEQSQKVLGVLYTSGTCSRSGEALIRSTGLRLAPSASIHVQRENDYKFVDWETGYPLPW